MKTAFPLGLPSFRWKLLVLGSVSRITKYISGKSMRITAYYGIWQSLRWNFPNDWVVLNKIDMKHDGIVVTDVYLKANLMFPRCIVNQNRRMLRDYLKSLKEVVGGWGRFAMFVFATLPPNYNKNTSHQRLCKKNMLPKEWKIWKFSQLLGKVLLGNLRVSPYCCPPFQEGIINHHDHGKANGFPLVPPPPQEIWP